MAAPAATRTASVPRTALGGAPARTVPRTSPPPDNAATPSQIGGWRGRWILSPGGSALLSALLIAVRIVIVVAARTLFNFGVVENDAQNSRLRLLQLLLHSPLGRFVLRTRTNDVQNAVGHWREDHRVRIEQARWRVNQYEISVFSQLAHNVRHPLRTQELAWV